MGGDDDDTRYPLNATETDALLPRTNTNDGSTTPTAPTKKSLAQLQAGHLAGKSGTKRKRLDLISIASSSSIFAALAPPWRWFVIFAFGLINFSGAVVVVTYVVTPNAIAKAFNVSVPRVTLLMSSNTMATSIATVFAGLHLERYGLPRTVILSGIFICVGCGFRISGTYLTIDVIMAGQMLCGVGTALITGAVTTLSLQWFPKKERVMAATTANGTQMFGYGMGFMLTPFILGDNVKENLLFLHLLQGGVALAGLILSIIAFCRNPPYPPRNKAESTLKGALIQYRDLLLNWRFMLMCVLFGWGVSAPAAVNGILGVLTEGVYSSKEIGLMLMIPLVVSFVLSAPTAKAVDSFNNQIGCFAVLNVFIAVMQYLQSFVLLHHHFTWAIVVLCFTPVFTLPLYGIVFLAGADHVFPIDESFSTSLVNAITGAIVSGALTLAQYMSDNISRASVLYMASFSCLFVAAVVPFVGIRNNRPKKKKRKMKRVMSAASLVSGSAGFREDEIESPTLEATTVLEANATWGTGATRIESNSAV